MHIEWIGGNLLEVDAVAIGEEGKEPNAGEKGTVLSHTFKRSVPEESPRKGNNRARVLNWVQSKCGNTACQIQLKRLPSPPINRHLPLSALTVIWVGVDVDSAIKSTVMPSLNA